MYVPYQRIEGWLLYTGCLLFCTCLHGAGRCGFMSPGAQGWLGGAWLLCIRCCFEQGECCGRMYAADVPSNACRKFSAQDVPCKTGPWHSRSKLYVTQFHIVGAFVARPVLVWAGLGCHVDGMHLSLRSSCKWLFCLPWSYVVPLAAAGSCCCALQHKKATAGGLAPIRVVHQHLNVEVFNTCWLSKTAVLTVKLRTCHLSSQAVHSPFH